MNDMVKQVRREHERNKRKIQVYYTNNGKYTFNMYKYSSNQVITTKFQYQVITTKKVKSVLFWESVLG